MKTFDRTLFFISALQLFSLSAFPQGSLTPPGPPAPGMKTLEQVEPRIDLKTLSGDNDYHYIITSPGSYYLSGNLNVTKTHGIYVRFVAGVTIDLNGFQIARTVGSGGNGVIISTASDGCTVRNGSIKGFTHGVHGSAANACVFRDLAVSECTYIGILAGRSAMLESCRAHNNVGAVGSAAILTYYGSILSNCSAYANSTNYGIWAQNGCTLSHCVAVSNTATGGAAIWAQDGCTLSHCVAKGNQAVDGILIGDGSILSNCVAETNVGWSLSAGIRTGSGCTVSHCSARFNDSTAGALSDSTGAGFALADKNTIQNCTASINAGDGFQIGSDTLVRDNTASTNGPYGAGIHARGERNRIDSNHVTRNNGDGIKVDDVVSARKNVVVRNTAYGNIGFQFRIPGIPGQGNPSDNDVGPIGTAASATSPWANISN